MIYFALAFELIILVFLSYGVEKLWSRYFNNKITQLALFPGTATHVLSHAFLCILTGATIKNLNIFKLGKNEILFVKPKISYLGNFLIAAAPIFGSGLIILLLLTILGGSVGIEQQLSDPNDVYRYMTDLMQAVQSNIVFFWEQISDQNIFFVVFISLSVILTISMAPNNQELKFLVLGFIVCGAIPFSLGLINISVYDHSWGKNIIDKFWQVMTISISVLAAVLCITLIMIAITTIFRRMFSGKGSGARKSPQISKQKPSKPKDSSTSTVEP